MRRYKAGSELLYTPTGVTVRIKQYIGKDVYEATDLGGKKIYVESSELKYTKPLSRFKIAKAEAMQLIACNPTLPMTAVARHVGVSSATIAKWFAEHNLYRWGA